MKYRADIDGLRAVAVLSVVWFHYGSPLPGWAKLPGGFTGVDVFFVISGFLITQQLYAGIEGGRFSILNFYNRRLKRILPALLVMLAIVLLAGKWLLMPGDYLSLAASTGAATFGASNFYFLFHTGYFDKSAELMPLLHTWSLGVEEQFYVVWPLLLFGLAKLGSRNNFAAITATIVIAGFGVMIVWLGADPKGAFYMPIPRAWELAIGALLVFLPPLARPLSTVAVPAGFILVAAGFFIADAKTFPGPSAALPCVGSAFILWPRTSRSTMADWLGRLHPIGLISYSLYLWHWPVWVLFRSYINDGTPSVLESGVLFIISIAVSTASYFVVEQPFRRKRGNPWTSVRAGLGGCIAIFCFAMYIHSEGGLPSRVPQEAQSLRSFEIMWKWKCPEIIEVDGLPNSYCVFGAPWRTANEHVILWGDSHADHLAPILNYAAREARVSVLIYRNCPPNIDGVKVRRLVPDDPDYSRRCAGYQNAILKFIRTHHIDQIVLSSAWSFMFKQLYRNKPDEISQTNGERLFETSLNDVIGKLSDVPQVTILADIPVRDQSPISCEIANLGFLIRRHCDGDVLTRAEFNRLQGPEQRIIEQVTKSHPNTIALYPSAGLCDDLICTDHIDGYLIYADRHHFRRNLPDAVNRRLLEVLGLTGLFVRPRTASRDLRYQEQMETQP